MAENKGVYGDEEDNKGDFDFEVEFDLPDEIQLKTACCCCFCRCDDCEDFMQVQSKSVCLWCQGSEGCRCCQCMDESGEAMACCQGTGQTKCCSMTDEEGGFVCLNQGSKGICCCCMVGQGTCSCCDPLGAPETCVKAMAQVFCIHVRSALPCDDDVPFEIGCCGVMCVEAEKADGGHD